jgi:LysR family transcriptional regulator, transcriptional activator for dmlA
MSSKIQPSDLGFFSVLASSGSLSAASRELGITTAAVSKHLAQMETRVGAALVNRTTRRMSLTPEGELYLEHARRILGDIEGLEELLGVAQSTPSGLLRVNATLGFGRNYVAPLLSKLVRKYPRVDAQLQLSVNPPALTEDAFDVCIRFGPPPDTRVIARRLASNRRLLCATPAYLERHGVPRNANDLVRHNCIGIRQGELAYGVWRLSTGRGRNAKVESVKTRGNLSSNDGEIAVNWALESLGIVLRSEWDIARHLRSGRLVQILPQYDTPDADIYAVYPQRHRLAARVRAFVDLAEQQLTRQANALMAVLPAG